METKNQLEAGLKDAMRSNDDLRKRVIRLALTSIRLAEVDEGGPLDDSRVQSVLQKEIKAREESIEAAKAGGRPDLIRVSEAEITVLKEYLPQQLSQAEIVQMVEAAIQEVGAASPADMGRVMKILLPRLAGRAPGGQVSQIVKQKLNE